MVEVRNIQDFNDYLDTLLCQTECDDIEFKSAAGGFPSSFWETYSAFATTALALICDEGSVINEGFNISMATSDANMATSPKKRLSKQQMNELIKVVCADWISLEDMASQIGRDYNYLRKFIIPRMLKEKRIEMLYPRTPNHPKQ